MNPAIVAGACVALMGRFEAETALDCHVPDGNDRAPRSADHVHRAAPGCPTGKRSCRGCVSCTPAAHRWRRTRCARSRPGSAARSLEGYGMTETAGTVTTHRVGQPLQARLGRHAGRRHGAPPPRRPRRRGRPGRDRRGRPAWTRPHEGVLAQPGRDERGHPGGRLVRDRRHGLPGRGRLPLPRRPQEGRDPPGRLQRLPARDRGRPRGAPGDPRSGRARRPRRQARGGGRRRRRAAARTAPAIRPR